MLSRLHIQNYAIIDELEIDFASDLNIITGETGAGKSILIGALNLILGQRADGSILRQQDKKCIIEGQFNIKDDLHMKDYFAANDLDFQEEILLRREIAPNGKSRSFINDTPVNLSQLKTLSVLLVDLHQQFDTLELATEDFQRSVLDAFAGNHALSSELRLVYGKYFKAKRQLEELQTQQQNADKELDYNRFLFDELEELSLKENELENLEAELRLLSNAENIKQQLAVLYAELTDGETPVLHQMRSFQNKLRSLQHYHPQMEGLVKQVSGAVLELQDVADELERIDNSVTVDPARIELISDRISAGYKLLKKHSVSHTSQLIDLKEALQKKLDAVLNTSLNIEMLKADTAALQEQCLKISGTISLNRKKQTKPLADKVNKLLTQVGMPNAFLKIRVDDTTLSATGTDEIVFLFDANKSGRFEPLGKVASGGELSRLMLSIKSLVARQMDLPTMIFDEIDTGISGEAAKQVGIIMKDLSMTNQLIAITHQPQIAARANAHYFVYKVIKADKIITSIRLLTNDERITTIAQMLSGEKPTSAALANAREMVGIS